MDTSSQSAGLHITIGAASIVGDELPDGRQLSVFRLEQELMLVKAALLYSDRATFYSPFASMVLRMARLLEEPIRDQLQYLEAAAERSESQGEQVAIPSTDVRKYREILRKSHPNTKQMEFKRHFEQRVRGFNDAARKLADDALADGIIDTINSGLLEVPRFAPTVKAEMENVDASIEDFLAAMRAVVSNPATYPLFDTGLSGWIASGIQDGSIAITESGMIRSKQIGLAAQLLERLPLFDLATIQEIVDIRRELERPLVRFRAGIIGFSENIKNSQWDNEFATEVQVVFYRDIEPAVLEIEEAIENNNYLKRLIRKSPDKSPIPVGSALGVAMSQLSNLPDVIAHGLGIAGTIGVGATLLRTFDEWRQEQQAIERNQLYFYYAAGERLRKVTRTNRRQSEFQIAGS